MTFPPNPNITLKTADAIVHSVCTRGTPETYFNAKRFGLTREEMVAFLERNEDALPPPKCA
ncbi:MAG: hypothetical protein KGL39_39815 [Patescibacteria group bacterium]|nr:hypothetical protein [Patescibacteria group bacterium]